MNFNPVNNMKFCATFVTKVPIIQNNENGNANRYDANLLEFDRENYRDMVKVRQICNMEQFCDFGDRLYDDLADDDYFSNVEKKRCFVLTENSENDYDNIDKDKVLGIYTIHEKKDKRAPVLNAYFMTNSRYRDYWGVKTKFQKIGHGMDEATKQMYPDRALRTNSARKSRQFWEKEGYKYTTDGSLIYYPDAKKENECK